MSVNLQYHFTELRKCMTPDNDDLKDCARVFTAPVGAGFHNCYQCLQRIGVSPVYTVPGFVPRETETRAIVVPVPVSGKRRRLTRKKK